METERRHCTYKFQKTCFVLADEVKTLLVVTLFIFEGDFLFAQLIQPRHDSVFSDFSEMLSNHIFEARVLFDR